VVTTVFKERIAIICRIGHGFVRNVRNKLQNHTASEHRPSHFITPTPFTILCSAHSAILPIFCFLQVLISGVWLGLLAAQHIRALCGGGSWLRIGKLVAMLHIKINNKM
jgi:hypothetical protein